MNTLEFHPQVKCEECGVTSANGTGHKAGCSYWHRTVDEIVREAADNMDRVFQMLPVRKEAV